MRRKKARRDWNQAWVGIYDWADFDREKARVFCKFCKEDKKSRCEFGRQGSINIQISALSDHANTKSHHSAYFMSSSKESIANSLIRTQDLAIRATTNLFAAAYHVAKEDLAFCKFPMTLGLLSFCGCSCLPIDMYCNDKSCITFVHYISESIMQKHIKRLNESPFFSLMMDESTDIQLKQHLIAYASFIEDYEPITIFLGLLEIDGGSSAHLHSVSLKFMSSLGLDIHKLVCFGSDGASAMISRHNGLSARLKRDNHFMMNIHCVAHRASLCLVDAVKDSSVAQELDACMNAIASLVSKSSLRTSKLESLQRDFGCAVLHMSRIHKVRWLSRHQVIHKVCESFEALLEFIKDENATFFATISKFSFIYNIHFMADVLERLAILSKIFQDTYVDVTAVVGLIEVKILALEQLFIEEPQVDVNASTMDRHEYMIIPD
ncbi:hypothetical protein L7F22_067217 [Adiantum nelumboides]|nr:hypothetical protein [Adiantum nelumboides]